MSRTFLLPDNERDNYINSIFGRKGGGKTFLAKEIAETEPRVIAIDNMGQFSNIQVVSGFDSCIKAIQSCQNLETFRFALQTTSEQEDLALIDLAYYLDKFTIIIDETSKYVSSSYLPREFEQLIRYGRHGAINQVYMSRRPAEIHRELSSQSDVIVSFHQFEERDVQYLRNFMGDDADMTRHLGQYEILTYGPESKMPIPILNRKYNA
jgi:hypothetical protein